MLICASFLTFCPHPAKFIEGVNFKFTHLQLYRDCLVRLLWFMRQCFFECLFKVAWNILIWFLSSLFLKHFLRGLVCPSIQLCSLYQRCKKFLYILSERSDFCMSVNLSIVTYVFALHMSLSLSVDEVLMSRKVFWFTNFSDLPVEVEFVAFLFKLVT